MMRPHCDRCDALCDECQTWVEDEGLSLTSRGVVAYNSIWHIVIHAGGQVPCEEKMFCHACRIAILEAYVKGLKSP